MSIANGLALPNPLSDGTTADAVPVMGDFNYLLAALNRALLDTGGGSGMNAQSTQIHNLANGTAANDAVNLSQLNGFAALAGAAFTGAVTMATTLGVAGLLSGSALSLSGSGAITGNLTVSGSSGVTASSILLNGTGANGGALFQPRDGTTGNSLLYSSTANVFALFVNGADRLQYTAGGAINVPGAFSAGGALSLSGALTPGSAANSVGYLGAPVNAKTTSYTLVLTDMGGTVDMNGSSLTLTIPANASVAFPVGTIILGTNLNATNLTIAITTDTLTISGTTTTGSRTIGQNGEFRLKKVSATSWLITGTAMT